MRMKKKSHIAAAKTQEPPKVLVSISLAHASWRDFLSGILRYVDENANWDVRIACEPGDLSAAKIDEVEREGFAGIILATPGAIDFKRLNRSPIPLAACGGWPELDGRAMNTARVDICSAEIGVVGARHLLARGRYSAYGFVRSRFDMTWSEARQEAFAKTVRASGEAVKCYALPRGAVQERDLSELRDWLLTLPRPAAVMADCDRRAAQVVAACRDGGLRVPDDVAVLGVDDDKFYALHTRPPLSSVVPGHVEAGYRIAQELDRMIRAGRPKAGVAMVKIHPKGVVARESTRPLDSSAALVRRAEEFIKANAAAGIKVADVVRHLGCSRRIAELRFRERQKQTIAEFIPACRLEEVKQRLSASSATVAEAAAECGFKTAAHLSHLFKRRFGQPIREWRSSLKVGGNS